MILLVWLESIADVVSERQRVEIAECGHSVGTRLARTTPAFSDGVGRPSPSEERHEASIRTGASFREVLPPGEVRSVYSL